MRECEHENCSSTPEGGLILGKRPVSQAVAVGRRHPHDVPDGRIQPVEIGFVPSVRLPVDHDLGEEGAVGVAAHECGHAIQDDLSYAPLRFRHAFVPLANIGSKLSMPMIIIGVMLGESRNLLGPQLINLGLLAFSLAVIFQLITLPVEFNASRRALIQLRELNILPPREESQARSVLIAAALTYVAGAASSLIQLLRLWILFGGRKRK